MALLAGLIEQLTKYPGDELCKQALGIVFETACTDITSDNVSTYLPLIRLNLPLSTSAIESLLTLIDDAFHGDRSQYHGSWREKEADKYCTAVDVAEAVLAHPSVRPRVDPCDDFLVNSAIRFVIDRVRLPVQSVHVRHLVVPEFDLRLVRACRKFLDFACRISNDDLFAVIQKNLGNKNDAVEFALAFGLFLDRKGVDAFLNEFEDFVRNKYQRTTDRAIESLMLLIDGTENLEWAKKLFVRSPGFLTAPTWGPFWTRKFCRKVVKLLTIEEVKEFMSTYYRTKKPATDDEWHFAWTLFKQFPDKRQELRAALGSATRSRLSWEGEKYQDNVIGPATRSSSDSESGE